MPLTSDLQSYLEREYGSLLDDKLFRLLGDQSSPDNNYDVVSAIPLTEDQIRAINKGVEAYERYRHLI